MVSSIFSLWGRILRTRADVYVQLLLTIVAAALIVGLVAIDAAAHAGQAGGLVVLIGVLAVVAELAFGYGAALGALGEAARGDPPSAFWTRGYRLWGRTLGLFGVNLLIGIALTIVILLLLAVTGAFTGLSHVTSLANLNLTDVYRLLGIFAVIVIVLVAAVGPYMQAAQAQVYVDQVPVLVAFSQAFAAAYGRGRFGHWLLVLLVAIVIDLAAGLIEQVLGTSGQLLGIVLSPAVLWLSTALAFATYRTHTATAAPADIIS